MPFEFGGVNSLQKYKLAIHILQSSFIAVAWILEIIVFRTASTIDGRPGWYFGLCFLTIPAIIYLTMTPRFPRTRKFANPYALAAVDFVWTIFWISAFASQASYNTSGKCKGACSASKAVVGLGVFIWLFWVVTTIISLYGVMYWKREGYLPGASRAPYNSTALDNDPDKEAFSTAPHDDEYAPVHNTDDHDHSPEPSAYGGSGIGHEPSAYGGAPTSAYGGSSGVGHPASAYGGSASSRYDGASGPSYVGGAGGYVSPSVHEEANAVYTGYTGAKPGAAHSIGGRVQFPDARYDNIGVLNG